MQLINKIIIIMQFYLTNFSTIQILFVLYKSSLRECFTEYILYIKLVLLVIKNNNFRKNW